MRRAGTYTTIKLGEDMVGGMLDMAARGVPEQVPAHWQVYFAVEDTDAAVEKAKERRRQRHVRADGGPGRSLRDPHRPARRQLRRDRAERGDDAAGAPSAASGVSRGRQTPPLRRGRRPRPRPPIRRAGRGWRS